MENETEHSGTRVVLQAWHYEAIELRYNGSKYKEIANALFDKYGKYILEGRIRKWFMTGGILHDLYAEYSKQQTEERRELMHQQLRQLGMKIPIVLDETLFRPLRNAFTGEEIKDNGKTVYVRDRTSNEAVKILATLLGAKFADDEAAKVGNVLDEYFQRLEKMPLPGTLPPVQPAEQESPAKVA